MQFLTGIVWWVQFLRTGKKMDPTKFTVVHVLFTVQQFSILDKTLEHSMNILCLYKDEMPRLLPACVCLL